jgi:purine nucleosidase
MESKPVILIQDGAVDELMSVFLLQSMTGQVDLLGIVVVNGDCLAEPTVDVTKKILNVIGTPQVPVAISTARAVNAFPWVYRQYCMMANLLPMLNLKGPWVGPLQPLTGSELIVQLINGARQQGKPKVTILGLSPMTPLMQAYESDATILDYIDSIVWMGGALKPEHDDGMPFGNVDTGLAPGANPDAEWNAFWDPFAVRDIWQTFAAKVPFIMFPLNVTNSVMLGPDFILRLAPQSREYPVYALAAQMYAMVAFEAGYAFWDTVTTAYLGDPTLYKTTPEPEYLNIVTTGPKQGLIFSDPQEGFPVTRVTDVDVDAFYDYLLEQWKMNLPGL